MQVGSPDFRARRDGNGRFQTARERLQPLQRVPCEGPNRHGSQPLRSHLRFVWRVVEKIVA